MRGLERAGLVSRTVTPTVPPCVDSALTALGEERMEPIAMLATWALRRREAVKQAHAAYDAREEPPAPREPR
ncbi:winged helix-turn-helix transcriptional regulator [Myxococcus xanthus]|uniref:winged helix-turn-helix transcriptional regulator n=1 Tax=Myxococcus xanthus TaxID=34 RepID=UPI001C10615F|nr:MULTISPECIES: winged helix-turn-helix transcriptional regulator [Myxococcus]UYI18538.1 winged helix-turn-helix transcriptional regulator [Myxococcus xanthus]UYI25969.1 winged helix-turn-helix transcriptional regulator [Myxococcus xanthus]